MDKWLPVLLASFGDVTNLSSLATQEVAGGAN